MKCTKFSTFKFIVFFSFLLERCTLNQWSHDKRFKKYGSKVCACISSINSSQSDWIAIESCCFMDAMMSHYFSLLKFERRSLLSSRRSSMHTELGPSQQCHSKTFKMNISLTIEPIQDRYRRSNTQIVLAVYRLSINLDSWRCSSHFDNQGYL